jgi:hypothetical protein
LVPQCEYVFTVPCHIVLDFVHNTIFV